MDLTSIPILAAINQRLKWLGGRQQLISQNIANANTPDYMPRDLKAQDFSDLLAQAPGSGAETQATGMRRTQPAHFDKAGGNGARPAVAGRQERIGEIKPNRNGVVLEEQLTAMADTQIEYNMMLNIYRKQMNMMRIALGRNGQR
ncbi:MAG: flagellar basal body rod protein FlgB [Pseudomonadota bacterium]